MTKAALMIDHDIFVRYPEVTIGYMVVDNLHNIALAKFSDDITNISQKGINENSLTLQNLVDFPSIAAWRQLYQECGVKPKTFKSSIESLLRRFVQKDYRPIIPVVDLYNYISAGHIISVGGYNWESIIGTLSLRYGRPEDVFIPLNGKESISITDKHIVYADEGSNDSIVCWQWNQKDSNRTMLTNEIKRGLFIFDSLISDDRNRLVSAMADFENLLTTYKVNILIRGVLDKHHPSLLI